MELGLFCRQKHSLFLGGKLPIILFAVDSRENEEWFGIFASRLTVHECSLTAEDVNGHRSATVFNDSMDLVQIGLGNCLTFCHTDVSSYDRKLRKTTQKYTSEDMLMATTSPSH